jgi:perosamine synthetase
VTQYEEPVSRAAPRYIPVARPSIGPAEKAAVAAALDSGWISSGPAVVRFEREFARAHGHYGGAACNSGTTALVLALRALGIGPGKIVACPTLTMVAVANAILDVGATPYFVDSRSDGTGNFSQAPEKSSAIVMPHLYGRLASLDGMPAGIPIIEDCAEAHYARGIAGENKHVTLSTFSFYANKIITTGEGGMVTSDDYDLLERVQSLRAHAFTPGRHFVHREHAYSYRMTDMQASLGLSQHGRRDELLARRTAVAEKYFERLASLEHEQHAVVLPDHSSTAVWWVYPITLGPACRLTTDQVRNELARRGIETRSFFVPLHRQPHLVRFANTDTFPVADRLGLTGFYLGCYPDLTTEDIDYTADALKEILA